MTLQGARCNVLNQGSISMRSPGQVLTLLVLGTLLLLLAGFDGPLWAAEDSADPPVLKAAGDQEQDESADNSRTMAMMASLTIFVLAIFVGFEIITKVPPTLHTPLMSGSNAISGIILVGAVIVAGKSDQAPWLGLLGMVAVALATVNVVGGFLVTHRMLSMFTKR